jgi:hypothetical protein
VLVPLDLDLRNLDVGDAQFLLEHFGDDCLVIDTIHNCLQPLINYNN